VFYALSKILDLAFAPPFWVLCLGAASGWAATRGRRRRAFTFGLLAGLALYVPCTGACARTLIERAERFEGARVRPGERYDAVILLGGFAARADDGTVEISDAADRLLRAWELYASGRAARIIVAAGGDDPTRIEADAAADLLTRMGVAPAHLLLDRKSRNTRENALEVRALVDAHQLQRLAVVTSAYHMERALGCLRAVDLHADALATDRRTPPMHGWFDNVAPRSAHLATSELALRELAGRLVYRLRGFTR